MPVIEAIKDAIGIMDDAGDFLDAARSEVDKADRILDRLERAGVETQRKISRLNTSIDLKVAKEVLESLDFARPFFFGKTMLQKLGRVVVNLKRLERDLSRVPQDIQRGVGDKVIQARNNVEQAIRENVNLLQQLSAVQQQRKDRVRAVVKALAISGVLSLATAGIAGFVLGQTFKQVAGLAGTAAIRGLLAGASSSLTDASTTAGSVVAGLGAQ